MILKIIIKSLKDHKFKTSDMVKLNKAAKEIHDRYMRFVEWALLNVIKNRFGKYQLIEIGVYFTTLEELFQYWQDKIDGR